MASFWYITVITIDVITNSQNYVNASMHFSVYYYYYFFYGILFILLFIFYHGLNGMSHIF